MSEDYTQRATCQCYYKFAGTGSDIGDDNQGNVHCTNVNSVTQSADVPSGTYAGPSAEYSALFRASDSEYLTAAHNDSTDIDDLTALTVVLWVKFVSFSDYNNLLYKSGWGADGYALRYRNVADPKRFRGEVENTWTDDAFAASTDTWYFIALSYSQANDQVRNYRGDESTEAVLEDTAALVDDTAATTYGLFMATQGTLGNYLDGHLCEVAIFSEELNATDITDIQTYGMEGSAAPAADEIAPMAMRHLGTLRGE